MHKKGWVFIFNYPWLIWVQNSFGIGTHLASGPIQDQDQLGIRTIRHWDQFMIRTKLAPALNHSNCQVTYLLIPVLSISGITLPAPCWRHASFPTRPVCLAPFPLWISAAADPSKQLSDHKCLTLHAEVVALQQHLGITYKDASHQLYMAELEKLKAADLAHKAFKISTIALRHVSRVSISTLQMQEIWASRVPMLMPTNESTHADAD